MRLFEAQKLFDKGYTIKLDADRNLFRADHPRVKVGLYGTSFADKEGYSVDCIIAPLR